jgi:hypothetical protein
MNKEQIKYIRQGYFVLLDGEIHEVGLNLVKDIELYLYKNIDEDELSSRLEFIELTEQWFTDFGLYVKSGSYTDSDFSNATQSQIVKDGGYYKLRHYNSIEYIPIKYVHHLQELYRVITHKPLKLQTTREVDSSVKL